MKKKLYIISLVAAFLFHFGICQSQVTASDFFNNTNIGFTWMGVDYTQVKYIGEQGTVDAGEMKVCFNKINQLMLNELEKYDVLRAFHRDSIFNSIGHIVELNQLIDTSKIVTTSGVVAYAMTIEQAEQMVKDYTLDRDQYKGLGVVYVASTIDKMAESCTFYVVCFDIATRNILFSEKLRGSASGFGFRNHWASCIYSTLKQIKSNKFKLWKKKYAPTEN